MACICGRVKKENNFVLAEDCNAICGWNNSPVQINYVNFHLNWMKQKNIVKWMFKTLWTSQNIGLRRGKQRWRCKLSKQCQLWTFRLSFCQSGRCMLNLWGYSSNRQYDPPSNLPKLFIIPRQYQRGWPEPSYYIEGGCNKVPNIFPEQNNEASSKMNYIKT